MINSGDTAWVLISTALVLFMVPGLAIFYGGMARRGNVLAMLQQNFIPMGVISITWVVIGYTLAYGNDFGGGLIGNLEMIGLGNLGNALTPARHMASADASVPNMAFVAYEMMFAIITPALITGATAGRLKFGGWVVFLLVWSIIVYPPIAHWLFNPSGWLAQLGAQDWAGGIVVHTAAGAATLAVLAVVGRRRNWPNVESSPHSLPLAILGAGILWFGWFGFNAGDGLAANGIAAQAFMNTTIAASAGMLIWLLLENRSEGHPTVLGAATGAVAGLATITPCAGYVNVLSAIAIGGIAGLVCHLALHLKTRFRFDDALDVIAVHFVGGVLGSLLLGFFAQTAINSDSANGLLFGGGLNLLAAQALAVVVVAVFSFVVSWLIAIAIEKTIKLREDAENQENLDLVQQGMSAYD